MRGGGVSNAFVDAPLAPYAVNNFLDGTPMYIGKAAADGRWLVVRFNSSTGVMDYANQTINAGVTNYAAAWTARAGLVYGVYGSVTEV